MARFRIILGFLMAAVCAMNAQGADSVTIFNKGWHFALGDCPQAAEPNYNDSSWRLLDLPHDWAIEGDFSFDNPSGPGGGALPGGIGWYRKHFQLSLQDGQHAYLDFDGAYMNATVFINGVELGTRPYGYASFSYDITPYLSSDNVVAVKVDNAEQPNSRWYSGCGIYRNTYLRIVNSVHIPKDGVFAYCEGNVLHVESEIANFGKKAANAQIQLQLMDPQGKMVNSAKAQAKPKAGASVTIAQQITVDNPQLWDIFKPNLYTLVASVLDSKTGQVLDTYSLRTGFRQFDWDASKGFSINGRSVKINGVCLHHDLGAMGAVANRRAIQRQLEIMKEMGANAIRCSHNPPAPELLDLCDEMGLLVMDETFDMWRKRKTNHDYSRYFDQWHERDIDDLIRRDRNHPSIFCWSIGNEVLEQWSDAGADTLSLAEANLILNFGHSADMLAKEGEMSVNSLLTQKLADRVRTLDNTRAITAGCNEPDPGNHLFRSGALDIIGFNYHDDWFKDVPVNFPNKPFLITESVSALMTRGYYDMPSDSISLWPVRWDIPFFKNHYSCSSYDNCHVPWGNTHEGTMRHVDSNDFISGQFVWTGFDYLGEPTPYGYPARSSYFGIVDLAGFPKDIYYLYQSQWNPDANVLHILPHWNWNEGETVDVWAYSSNADEVELFLNGKSLGARKVEPGDYHQDWRVAFEPGTLTAVSRKDGAVVKETTVRTAGMPHHLRLAADRQEINADGSDLSYVAVEVVDADGNLCPWATDNITFDVQGAGFNAGVDNGSPISLERFKADHRKAFYGKAMLIVQNDGHAGDIRVSASAPGLGSDNLTLKAL